MNISERITAKLTSARAICLVIMVSAICYGALKFGTDPWMLLLSNAASFLLGNYSNKDRQPPPGSGKTPG